MSEEARRKIDDLKRKWPDGYAAAAHLLLSFLHIADSKATPLELWGRRELDGLVQEFRVLMREARGGATVEAGQEQTADREFAKLARAHCRRMEDEGSKFLARLAARLSNDRTKVQTAAAIREWRKLAAGMDSARRGRKLLDLLQTDFLEVPSDNLTRQVLEKIERADFAFDGYEWPTATGEARGRDEQGAELIEAWALELMPSGEEDRRKLVLPAADIDIKVRQAMWAYARGLGDRDSDLMAEAMRAFVVRAKHPDDKVVLHIDELMEACGYAKHRSGSGGEAYRERDKAAVRERLEALQSGHLTVRGAGKSGRKTVDIESRVLTIHDRAGQADLVGRVAEWSSVTVGFGRAWSQRLFTEQGRLTALLQAAALSYDAVKERPEKRILKRLAFFWRINGDKLSAERTVRSWITSDVGDNPDAYVRRHAERLEDAFNRLRADGHIADWGYSDGASMIKGEGDLPKGWLRHWLDRRLWVGVPEALRLANAARRPTKAAAALPPAPVVIEAAPDGLGQRVRQRRIAMGVSGLRLAGQLGIDNTALSRIETGRRLPTKAQADALVRWLVAVG